MPFARLPTCWQGNAEASTARHAKLLAWLSDDHPTGIAAISVNECSPSPVALRLQRYQIRNVRSRIRYTFAIRSH